MLTIANPPSKKRKVEKKSRAEKAMEKTVDAFVKYQREAEERFQKSEDERWKKETDLEENRRREDQQHEMRMLQMLGQMFQGGSYRNYTPATGPQYNFENSDYYQ